MTKKEWSLALASIAILTVATVLFLKSARTSGPPGSVDASRATAALPDRPASEEEEETERQDSAVITGQMTLLDVQRISGIPATEIAARLSLPPDAPTDESLGRLRQQYSFTIDQVRNIVARPAETGIVAASLQGVEVPASAAIQIEPHEEEPHLTRGRGAEDPSGILITGQMSLREIELRSGVSARLVADRLGLPRGASLDAPLGRLRRTYRFTMQDVRDIVSDLVEHPRQ
jgi:hypothetical protein